MAEAGCKALAPRRRIITTTSNPRLPVFPNLLQRNFTVSGPNQVWASDITYCPTSEGWLFLAVVMDLFSRRVVGWAVSRNIDQRLAVTAWERAVALRPPGPGLIHHSDRGSVYASAAYRAALASWGAIGSMSRKGDCWDNAVVESFFATLKRGLVDRRKCPCSTSWRVS